MTGVLKNGAAMKLHEQLRDTSRPSIVAAYTVPTPLARVRPRITAKHLLFFLLALAVLFVLYHNERFVLHRDSGTWKYFYPVRWTLLVHVFGGATALLAGPLQFSTRLRERRPALHHLIGYLYMSGVLVGASTAAYLGLTHAMFPLETIVQAALWVFTTAMALLAVRNQNFEIHRQWMMRSYAVTLIFVVSRVLLALPILASITNPGAERVLWILNLGALLVPQIIINWRQLFTRPSR